MPRLDTLAEAELARSGFRLAFPPILETRYWRDIMAERVRQHRFIIIWGLVFYVSFGVLLNLTVIPNPDWTQVTIQLLAPGFVGAIMAWIWLRDGSSIVMREAALMGWCWCGTLAAILVVGVKPSPATIRDFLIAIPPSSFVLIVVRLRFSQAVVFFLTNICVYGLTLHSRPEIDGSDAAFLIGFMGIMVLLPALIGVHAFERASRRIYLLGLLDRLRNENLAAENTALTDLSNTDPLTGVANRRRLDKALSAFCAAPGSLGALLLVDVDLFKAFNDRYGHLAGDDCLHQIAQCLSLRLRRLDLIARFGGEEFAVLLPEATIDEAAQTAERLREAVQRLRFVVQGEPVNVTVSIGLATRRDRHTPEAMIGAADTALYAAKHAGRNRVEAAQPEQAA